MVYDALKYYKISMDSYMKEINKMRLGVLRELKNLRRFIDNIERSVKGRDPEAIQCAYMFLMHLVREMDDGLLTPDNIAVDVGLAKLFKENREENNESMD